MSITTYTREARCRDCKHCVKYSKPHWQRYRHFCLKKGQHTGKNDSACGCIYSGCFEYDYIGDPRYVSLEELEKKYVNLINHCNDNNSAT